jgi:hypothetical protein
MGVSIRLYQISILKIWSGWKLVNPKNRCLKHAESRSPKIADLLVLGDPEYSQPRAQTTK